MITPTRWCGNECPQVRSQPCLTNLEQLATNFAKTLLAVEKTVGVTPG